MQKIPLTDELDIKKLNPNNPLDTLLIEELCQDEEICGEKGYLWPLTEILQRYNHLLHNNLYDSPYIIYHKQYPIGYLEISPIFVSKSTNFVDIAYALHKEIKKKGYMCKILEKVSDLLLYNTAEEIKEILLETAPDNEASRKVAKRAGFIEDGLSEKEHLEQGFVTYQKKRK